MTFQKRSSRDFHLHFALLPLLTIQHQHSSLFSEITSFLSPFESTITDRRIRALIKALVMLMTDDGIVGRIPLVAHCKSLKQFIN